MPVKKQIAMVADDEADFCKLVRGLTKEIPNLAFLPDAHDGKEALAAILTHHPDLAILDIQMPYLGGRDVLREILLRKLKTCVVFLTAHNQAAYFDPSFWSGALGIFYKLDIIGSDGTERFVMAIKGMLNGLPYVSPTPLHVIRKLSFGNSGHQPEEILTQNERDILKLLVKGSGDKEIAGLMGLSIPSVERRKQSLRRKLGVRSTSQLVAYAVRYWHY